MVNMLISEHFHISEDMTQYVQRLEARIKLLEEEKQALQQKLGQTPWEPPSADNVSRPT